MNRHIQHMAQSVVLLVKSQGILAACILSFTVAILFENHLPLAEWLILTLAVLCMQTFNLRRAPGKKLYAAAAILFAAALYGAMILTEYRALRYALESLLFLWGACNGIFFCSFRKDYVPMLVQRLTRMAIALAWAFLVGVIVFLIAYFIEHIFMFSRTYTDFLLRAAAASAGFVWCVALFSPEEDRPFRPGPFFTRLFGVIIPYLSAAAGILGVIYMIQILLGAREDVALRYAYYPYMVLFYLSFIFSFLCPVKPAVRRLVHVLFLLLPLLCIALLVKRQFEQPGIAEISFYGIIVNALFLAYNLELCIKNQPVNARLSAAAALIALAVWLPFFGYADYTRLVSYSGEKGNLTAHFDLHEIVDMKLEKNALRQFYEGRGALPGQKEIFYFSVATRDVDISVEGYKTLRVNAHLSGQSPYEMGAWRLSPSADKKSLLLTGPGVEDTIPVYAAAKKARGANTPPISGKPLQFEGAGYRLIIYDYSYSELSGGHSACSISFSFLTQ